MNTTCRHGNTPREDVTGNPLQECSTSHHGNVEYGAFNPEGCFYSGDSCAVDAANTAAQESETEDDITWGRICSEHDGEPASTCQECNTEDADDESEEEGPSSEQEEWDNVPASEIGIGDYLMFMNLDNGKRRAKQEEGYVVKITSAAILVKVYAHLPLRRISRASVRLSGVYRRRRRQVPYHTDFCHTVVEPHSITVLWSPVPISDPQHVMDNILNRELYGSVETVATAERVYARDGAARGYSGWFLNSGGDCSSEPYRRKADAMDALADMVVEYFRNAKPYLT